MIKPSNRKVVVVDVDLTVVDAVGPWVDYMNKLTGASFELSEGQMYPYNLTGIFKHYLEGDEDIGMLFDYWKQRDVYDGLTPYEGAVEVLGEISKRGYDVVFASVVKGDHSKSKYYFLKKHFPFMAGCVFTREKGYIKADYAIDDRNDHLRQFDIPTKTIRMNSQFTQDVDVPVYASVDNWEGVRELIDEGEFR